MSFQSQFKVNYKAEASARRVSPKLAGALRKEEKDADKFFEKHCGSSYNNGIYRIHDETGVQSWTACLQKIWPEYKGAVLCFGCDWLGRQFAIDRTRKTESGSLVLMLEPGTGELLEIPGTFLEFHNSVLMEYRDAALAVNFFEDWRSQGNSPPSFSECVGYIKPLFLGGEDVISNLEITDMEVYWHVCGELILKTRHLDDGAPIREVNLD